MYSFLVYVFLAILLIDFYISSYTYSYLAPVTSSEFYGTKRDIENPGVYLVKARIEPSGVTNSIIEGANIHIFLFTDLENN
jgi:hypothetical protein